MTTYKYFEYFRGLLRRAISKKRHLKAQKIKTFQYMYYMFQSTVTYSMYAP